MFFRPHCSPDAYCDLTVRRLAPRRQLQLHTALLIVSAAVLPTCRTTLETARQRKSFVADPRTPRVTIGLPYFLLSTTGPLVQVWFSRAGPAGARIAYSRCRIRAAMAPWSAIRSCSGWAPTRGQALGWSFGYSLFIALTPDGEVARAADGRRCVVTLRSAATAPQDAVPPSVARQVLWCALRGHRVVFAGCIEPHHAKRGVGALLDRAAHDLPAHLHPASTDRLYRRQVFRDARGRHRRQDTRSPTDLATARVAGQVFCAGLFLACMFCHGELVRSKPSPTYLTRFT